VDGGVAAGGDLHLEVVEHGAAVEDVGGWTDDVPVRAVKRGVVRVAAAGAGGRRAGVGLRLDADVYRIEAGVVARVADGGLGGDDDIERLVVHIVLDGGDRQEARLEPLVPHPLDLAVVERNLLRVRVGQRDDDGALAVRRVDADDGLVQREGDHLLVALGNREACLVDLDLLVRRRTKCDEGCQHKHNRGDTKDRHP